VPQFHRNTKGYCVEGASAWQESRRLGKKPEYVVTASERSPLDSAR